MERNGKRPAHRWQHTRVGATLFIALGVSPVAAEIPELPKTIPAGAVVAYFVTPPQAQNPTDETRSSLSFATLLADQAQSLGLLSNIDATTRAWIDTLTAAGVLLGYPHAAALFDIKAESLGDGGHKLAGLHAALVIQTGGSNSKIEQRIQHLLSTYTNSEATQLEQDPSSGAVVYTLTDKRLPDWFVLRWGAIGNHYVIAIGDGTYARVGRTLSGEASAISSDKWFAAGYEKTSAKKAFFTLFARFDRIDFSADSQLARKVGAVRHSVSFDNVDRGMWTVGFDGRAVDAKEFVRRNDQNQLRYLTVVSLHDVAVDKLIPPRASAYAVFDTSPTTILNAASEIFLAVHAADTQEETRAYWRNLQKKSGIDIHRDIVAHLARGAVIHDHPPHLLKLPLAWTFVARVTHDPKAVGKNIDALCEAWQSELRETGMIRLRHAPDGVWFLDFGIPGPAVGIRGPWIVMSYSPFAVRENLTFLAGPAPPAETPQTPTETPKKPPGVSRDTP